MSSLEGSLELLCLALKELAGCAKDGLGGSERRHCGVCGEQGESEDKKVYWTAVWGVEAEAGVIEGDGEGEPEGVSGSPKLGVYGICRVASISVAWDERAVTQPLRIATVKMASKYAFAQGLKELRFHLCQTSAASEATR